MSGTDASEHFVADLAEVFSVSRAAVSRAAVFRVLERAAAALGP